MDHYAQLADTFSLHNGIPIILEAQSHSVASQPQTCGTLPQPPITLDTYKHKGVVHACTCLKEPDTPHLYKASLEIPK